MAKKKIEETKKSPKPVGSTTARENHLISLAMDVAEQQLLDGTASSSVIVHYLKLGCSKDKLEKEKLEKENELLKAKTEALQSTKHMEELYEDALRAMSDYKGETNE